MTKNYLSVVYDEKSHPYTDYPKQLCAYLFQIFKLKKGMKMLEPGCGRGEFLNNFKWLGLDVVGVDISVEAVNFDNNLDVKKCDIENEKLPFKDDFFDVIYSKSFIEHLYYPERYLEEAFRVLKPGGILITLVPDWESNYKIYFDDFTHRTPFTNIALEDAYNMYGFSEVNVFKFRQLPIVWKYPKLNNFCAIISPLIPIRTKNNFFRWSRELMLVGVGKKIV
ncbi:MAG: class I SAM-dependent methyltransferase [Candidatus Endonucleobacter sp. (ex Gigantidas childressi)]|nr:class I SAM-dependent methyltransferase [Candidatus Endonucleobacter sp. (ex Gigantidas childressi)]